MTRAESIRCTIHTRVEYQDHRHDEVQSLPDVSVESTIHQLVALLGLQAYLAGPQQAFATLHTHPDGPALDPQLTLSAAGLAEHGDLWLILAPRFLPVVLHWHDSHGDVAKRVFLERTKTIGEHAAMRARLIPAARVAVDGPERCHVSLRTSSTGADLPAELTLEDVGIQEEDTLWLVWSPTVAEVVLHYSDRDTRRYEQIKTRKVFLPLTLPIYDIKTDVATQAGLPNPHDIRLGPAQRGRPWPDGDTLAQHSIQKGSTVWARVDQPSQPIVTPTPALAVLVAVVIVIIGSVWLFFPKDTGSALAETATPLPIATPTRSARPALRPATTAATPALAADLQLRGEYQAGVTAYQRQDWPEAAALLKRVYALDPRYQDAAALLAECHYQWAEQTLTGADRVDESLAILGQTFVYSPTHTTARAFERRLVLYRDGATQLDGQQWEAAIATFSQLRALQQDFLDVSQRLYDAHMGRAQQVREAGDMAATREQCTRAFELQLADTSAAQHCLAALQEPPSASPAPPTPTQLVLVQVPDVRGADIGKARDFLRARGFRVAVTELTRKSDIGALCNGMVSYSSPPKGKRIPAGSLVRLYYRGYTRPNPAQCG